MKITVDVKISDKQRVKRCAERIARRIILDGFAGDIEMIEMVQAFLYAAGADVDKIEKEISKSNAVEE